MRFGVILKIGLRWSEAQWSRQPTNSISQIFFIQNQNFAGISQFLRIFVRDNNCEIYHFLIKIQNFKSFLRKFLKCAKKSAMCDALPAPIFKFQGSLLNPGILGSRYAFWQHSTKSVHGYPRRQRVLYQLQCPKNFFNAKLGIWGPNMQFGEFLKNQPREA